VETAAAERARGAVAGQCGEGWCGE
jgi:hypothetical protein